MPPRVYQLDGSTQVESAVAELERRARRGQIRPGAAVKIRALAEQFQVRPGSLRRCIEAIGDSDLLAVRADTVVVAPLDLRELRSAMNMIVLVLTGPIARVPTRLTPARYAELNGLLTTAPTGGSDLYDRGRVFMRRLISIGSSRHEEEIYSQAIDVVSRYEYLGRAVLEQAEEIRPLSTAEHIQSRLSFCRDLLDLCVEADPEHVVALLRRYHGWASGTAELSFEHDDVAVRRILRSVT